MGWGESSECVIGVAVRSTAQRRSLAHTFLGQGVFFSVRSMECLRLSSAPGSTSLFYRDLAEDLSALSRQSAEISWSPNLPLRARSETAPRVASTGRIPVATKSAATSNPPGRRVRWPPSLCLWDRTGSEPPGPRLCVLGGNVACTQAWEPR